MRRAGARRLRRASASAGESRAHRPPYSTAPVGKVRRAGGVQIGPGTEARVNAGMFFQHLQGLCVQFAAFTLKIGAVRPASPAAFVPIQPQPGQVLLQKARVLRACSVGRPDLRSAVGSVRPRLRAESQASTAQNTLPRCIRPEGLGAKRPHTSVRSRMAVLRPPDAARVSFLRAGRVLRRKGAQVYRGRAGHLP